MPFVATFNPSVELHQFVEEPHLLLARLHDCNAAERDYPGVARASVALEAPVGEHLSRLVDLKAGAGVTEYDHRR